MSTLRHVRFADFSLFVGAFILRWGWMARWGRVHAAVEPERLQSVRRVFDGHERLLFEAFLGQAPTPSPQAWPLSIVVHQLLGLFSSDPRALLLLAVLCGSLTPVFVAAAVRRHVPPDRRLLAGLSAGVLVGLLPEHAAWSTSATPVVHGLACLSAAFALRSPPARMALAAMAAGFRPELAVPALFLGAPGGAAVVVAAIQVIWFGGPPAAELLPVLRVNLPLVVFIGPASLGFAFVAIHNRRTATLAALVVVVHGVGACFSDYGSRHALPAGVALCALAALDARKVWLPVVIGVGLLPGLAQHQARWHHPEMQPSVRTDQPGSAACLEISDEPPVPGQPRPSWVALVGGRLSAPCFAWGEAPEHTEWSSRGLWDRAIRMKLLWELSPREVSVPGNGRPWRRTWVLVDGPGLRGSIHTPPELQAP